MMIFADANAQVAVHRVAATWPWYIVRGAGFAAAGLLILLMLSGIGQVTGLTYRIVEPVKAWAIHRALAIALCFSIALHVIFLLVDHFARFTVAQVLVPFASHYKRNSHVPFGSLWVAFGVLAMYGVALLVASSLGWIDTKKGAWRKLHYVSYAVMVLAYLHALFVGSDLSYGTFRAAWLAVGVVLGVAVVARLLRAGTMRRTSAPKAGRQSSRDE